MNKEKTEETKEGVQNESLEVSDNDLAASAISNEMQKHDTTLSGDELARAKALAASIDVTDETELLNFGVDTQKKLGDSANKMLEHVKTSDAGEAGEALGELVKQVQSYDVKETGWDKMLKAVGLGKLVDRGKKIITAHKNVEANLDGVKIKLDESRIGLIKANANANILIDESIDFLRENKINVEAIRIKQNEIRDILLPAMNKRIKAQKNSTEKAILIQEKSSLNSCFISLDKKVTDLEMVNTMCLQSLPRLEMIKTGNVELATKIQQSVLTVLPMWKSQIAEALQLQQQKEVADVIRGVTDITNQMIVDNAKTSKDNMLAVAKESERSVIDLKTLENSNKMLFETIKGVIEIKNQGAKNRAEAQVKLKQIKQTLRENVDNIQSSIVDNTNTKSNFVEFEEVDEDTKVTSILSDDEKAKGSKKEKSN